MKLSGNVPTERLKEMLGELGIDNCYDNYDHGMIEWHVDGIKFAAANAWNVNDPSGTGVVLHVMYPNPEWVAQAISKLLNMDDPDDGMPLWMYLFKVAKSLENDALNWMEGADGDEFADMSELCGISRKLDSLARRMKGRSER